MLIKSEAAPFAVLRIDSLAIGVQSDSLGRFVMNELPLGRHTVIATYVGYKQVKQVIALTATRPKQEISFTLEKSIALLNQIVVTGTKTEKRRTESAVIVNVISRKTMEQVQACNLSEGLKFQPGLRVETDCQTCNYTQLRMNGLAGGYSQILINGRPIFSPLTGLYGMEQLPAEMIDRIEVVRGGGSSLYGSSAIGGTVNVITRLPKADNYGISYLYQNIDGQNNDHNLSGHFTLVSEAKDLGASVFFNRRSREFFDFNNDGFSELPLIENKSLGASFYLLPNENQKIEFNASYIDEYRFGGEMISELSAHLAEQSEERDSKVWMGSLDHQVYFNERRTSLITYAAGQYTDRSHYTGIRPEEEDPSLSSFLAMPPYGSSDVRTLNAGVQLDHRADRFILGRNTFSLGIEYLYDDVRDEVSSYNYLIDQTTRDLGIFAQSDWALTPNVSLLSGLRVDEHNLVDDLVLSPRASLLYKYRSSTQFRLNYGAGFRAPQAFDTDLHIAFSGGGVSRVSLSPELSPETSESWSMSVNFDRAMERWIAGFTLEGFSNRLHDAFILQPIGEDEFGERFVKENGQGARVQGGTLELRANYLGMLQIEGGFTLQSSRFDEAVEYIEGVDGIREFIRTPQDYGYVILTFNASPKLSAAFNYVYTGHMEVPHFAGAPNQVVDEIVTSEGFSELSGRIAYTLKHKQSKSSIQVQAGVKNIFDAYQRDFDIGKYRDSNYIYGPAQPRTYFIGLSIKGS